MAAGHPPRRPVTAAEANVRWSISRWGIMLRKSLDFVWRILVCGFVFASGVVASRLALHAANVSSPRMPNQAPESVAGWYLLAGSIVLAAGMSLSYINIRRSFPIRWFVLAAFLFTGFSVSTTIEAAIFSSTISVGQMIAVMFLPCILLTGVGTLLFKPRPPQSPPRQAVVDALRGLTWSQWLLRLILGIIAFPVTYFVFGIIVSPIVSPYYEQEIAGLVLPEPGVVLYTQLLRGGIHLLAVMLLMIFWNGSRRQLILFLGLVFFIFVTAYDFVLAFQVPAVLVVIHGIEVLTSSFVYSWILVSVLVRNRQDIVGKAI